MTVLDRILLRTREDLARRMQNEPMSELQSRAIPGRRSFAEALRGPGRALIAEFKPASPSRGSLQPRDEIERFAALYEGRASAMSVLCDRAHFDGGHDLLQRARRITDLPLLCKDFILEPYQVIEARVYGADAILLMAAILDDTHIVELSDLARELQMASLVEVHDQDELDRVLSLDAAIVGVNSRNLHDLTIDPGRMRDLVAQVPGDRIVVAESGVQTRLDVEGLPARADAVLIGSAFMAADDPAAKLEELGW